MRCYFTSCTIHTLYDLNHLTGPSSRQLRSQILSVSNEMLFHQLYLYDSCKSNHLTGQPLYSCLMRCNHVIYFTLLHSNISHSPLEPTAQICTTRVLILRLEQVVSIGHVCYSHSSTLAFNPIN